MHMTVSESSELVKGILAQIKDNTSVDVVIAPAFTSLGLLAELLKDTKVALSAQNMHWENQGAYTGEISPLMLKDAGCSHVIIGHSERRQYFGETDETVNMKIKAAVQHGLQVIMCVGESLEERKSGVTFKVLERQLAEGLKDLKNISTDLISIAYEPVWAIGTGMKATDEQANDAHNFIRSWMRDACGKNSAESVRILYGGSVKPESIDGLMAQPEIDGALVGGASLKADSFARLVNFQSA